MIGATAAECVHLARRLFATARPAELTAEDRRWARALLDERMWELWSAQAAHDRRHSVAVAREVSRAVAAAGEQAPSWVLLAALLHDVGKAEVPLGVPGRVLAGVLKLVRVGRFPGSIGRYLRYPQAGATKLAAAGADPRVVAWAAEHHRPVATCSLPVRWAARLAAADRRAV